MRIYAGPFKLYYRTKDRPVVFFAASFCLSLKAAENKTLVRENVHYDSDE